VHGLAQRGRRDQEAEAQGRQQRLREGTHVDHPPGGIERLQRFDRSAVKAELAVVVVLDHGGVVALGPGQ
jgi:hypothetical protein